MPPSPPEFPSETTAGNAPGRKPGSIHEIKHPVLAHLLSEARDHRTDTDRFRELVQRLGALLAYEATRDLTVKGYTVRTPLEAAEGQHLARALTVVPILRAGLGLSDGIQRLIPGTQVGHIGMFRDEEKLSPIHYYEKLPASIAQGPVLLVDPMLATGGSALAGLELLKNRGCTDIRFLCIVAAPEGLDRLTREHPDVPIYTAGIDRELDDRGYILPGLGDAGDRVFGTMA